MRVFTVLGAGIMAGLPATAFADLPPRIPVEALFSNPAFSEPDLSDDGSQLVYVQSRGDLRVVVAQPLAGGKPTPLAKFDDPQMRPNRLEWVNDRRILISAHARDPDSVGMRSRVTRVFGVDSDGRNFKWLGRNWPVHGQRALQSTVQDRLVHLTPKEPKTVLISYWARNEDSPQVMRMNVDNGELTVAEKRQKDIYNWYADSSGAVRAGTTSDDDHYQLWARVDVSKPFKLVSESDRFEEDGVRFVDFHSDPRKLYVTSRKDDRWALFEFDIETGAIGSLVEANPEFDVAGVEISGSSRQVVGVRYTDDRRRVRYFDGRMQDAYRQLCDTLVRELGQDVDVVSVSESVDGSKQVLEVSSDRQPPVYYFYDRSVRRIERLFAELPDVPVNLLAPTRRVTYRARDGLAIPAYLTLPVGVEPRALPAIALVHGGPWSRDLIAWDPEVQLLANRGFAVLQVNYRGSSGFGKAFRDSGDREWGQKIQDDITDGVQWLVDEGIADTDRIGIMGASYGGYAALMGVVKTPGLFRAGIAYAAVTDIETMISDDRWYGSDETFHRKRIGGEIGDADRLRSNSPLRRAGEIRVPVLLGHGEDDQRVHVRESRMMVEALETSGSGKLYEYMEFPHEIHGFALESNRIRWYTRVATFLEENLAPRKAATASSP
jgi:dipeptidyl aminopeptidase/acylaminoacyl peptidase